MAEGPRNPLILPDVAPAPKQRGCPKCGAVDFTGLATGGIVTFRCLAKGCGNSWEGGIGVEPQDPRIPHPPQDPRTIPTSDFEKDKKDPNLIVEFSPRSPDPTPAYRTGMPAPEPGEEDV